MKKVYVKPEMELTRYVFSTDVLRPGKTSGGGDGTILGNERNTGILDDAPAASGDEGGYKRTLW